MTPPPLARRPFAICLALLIGGILGWYAASCRYEQLLYQHRADTEMMAATEASAALQSLHGGNTNVLFFKLQSDLDFHLAELELALAKAGPSEKNANYARFLEQARRYQAMYHAAEGRENTNGQVEFITNLARQ